MGIIFKNKNGKIQKAAGGYTWTRGRKSEFVKTLKEAACMIGAELKHTEKRAAKGRLEEMGLVEYRTIIK
jgi:hypothetical protein